MLNIITLTVGMMSVNCYFLINTDYPGNAVVIDPGDNFEEINKLADSLNISKIDIVLTHAHFDHIGAVDALCNKYSSRVYVHEDDRALLTDPTLNLSANFFRTCTVNNTNIEYVNDNSHVNLIGLDFVFIHTPGHTPGSACIKVDDNLFTGDTLFYLSIGNAFPPYGDTMLEIESIKTKLYSLADDLICYPGHGQNTSLSFEKNNNPYTGDKYSGY